MFETAPRADALVLYKTHPARVVAVADKIEIELEGGQTKRVRPKDIVLLHPGPLHRLADLGPRSGNLDDAWELLEGAETNLAELAELVYDELSPATAWAAWQLVADGLYFEGTPAAIRARAPDEVEHDRAERQAKANAEQEAAAFMERLRAGHIIDADRERLVEVERLANAQTEQSRILKSLDIDQSPAHAYRFLTRIGYWPADHNPFPGRFGAATTDPDLSVPDLADENRLDLTALPAFAIDDEGNQDPDDAVSIDGDRIWVHVADVAALVRPDDALDREARARGANLYLPEGIVNMLPAGVTERLGLGLQPISPALSFGFRVGDDGELSEIDIRPTLVRVERISYQRAEGRLDEPILAALLAAAERYGARRRANGAARIDLPEVSVRCRDGEILIRPIERLYARQMVTDLMLMAGEAAATWCGEHGLPIPHAQQPPPERIEQPETMSGMFAYRRLFKPTRTALEPGPHFGLGLARYARATSPLRRYADLLVHQQIRASLRGDDPLTEPQVSAHAGEADQSGIVVRRTERQSNQHWKLVWLKRNPGWRGEAIVVEQGERKATVMIPELALEAKVRAKAELQLDQPLRVAVANIDLAEQDCRLRIL